MTIITKEYAYQLGLLPFKNNRIECRECNAINPVQTRKAKRCPSCGSTLIRPYKVKSAKGELKNGYVEV